MNPEQSPEQQSSAQIHQAPEPRKLIRRSGAIEAVTTPGEQLIFKTRKHLFGLAVMYFQALTGFIVASGLMIILVPEFFSEDSQPVVQTYIALGVVLFGTILGLILLLVTYIYRQNMLILTNMNVTQIIKNGLFARQVSELSLNNIEDVTSDKRGFWATILNFGEVRIETAGEQNNFHFKYCPNPDYYGQLLLDTRAECIRKHPNPPH